MATVNIPAVAVLIRKENKALFLLREHTNWMNGYYTLPAGHVESMESFRQAAERELKEEVGLTVQPEALVHLLTMHESKAPENLEEVRIGVLFELTSWQGEPYNAEPEVHGEMVWLDLDNLPDNIVPFCKVGLPAILRGEPYIEFGW